MSKLKSLIVNYGNYIAIPWRNVAPAQRVIFCVYDETDELKLRAKIEDFELATQNVKRNWLEFDLTNTFAEWLVNQRYVKSYFERPELINSVVHRYLEYLELEFEQFLLEHSDDKNTVVALSGVGSLFGLLKVKEVIEKFTPKVKGRLLVLFPGKYEDNNYRLLDGYDGWNYLAVTLTEDNEIY